MNRLDLDLSWIPRAWNKKTGPIPTAYVGTTILETRESCRGCGLYSEERRDCYAWTGFTNNSARRMFRLRDRGKDYSLERALRERHPGARSARISALGDPAHVSIETMSSTLDHLRAEDLSPLVYTHHWREPFAENLRDHALASCNDGEEGVEALDLGWVPAVVLPWYYAEVFSNRFELDGSGVSGVVCPAQTKTNVTCDDCRLCSRDHPVWKRGKINAIGFLNHSRKANREKTRASKGKQLPLFDAAFDVRA